MSANLSKPRKLISTLITVVNLLVRRDYDQLEKLSDGVRLKAQHIKGGVDAYGKTLAIPPANAFEEVDVIKVEGAEKPTYSIRFRLFTEEEHRSDLELQATFIDADPESDLMTVEIDDVTVA
jgi:hypothetical protein